MSRSTPFLIGKGAGGGVARMLLDAGAAAKSSPGPQALSPAEQAVVTVDFRNSRREGFSMDIDASGRFQKRGSALVRFRQKPPPESISKKKKSSSATSAQFVEVHLRVPRVEGLERLFPRDFASRIRRCASHHARKRGFGTLVRLIVEIPAGDALDERFLLFTVRKLQVGSELPCRGKRRLPHLFRGSALSLPRFLSPNSQRPGIRGLRGPFRSKKAFGHFPPAFGKLRRTKRDVNAIGIVEQHVVVSIDVTVSGTPRAPAARRSFQRVGLQHPVANVDDVNVLFHDDVSGKNTVINPIAKAALHGSGVRPSRPVEIAG